MPTSWRILSLAIVLITSKAEVCRDEPCVSARWRGYWVEHPCSPKEGALRSHGVHCSHSTNADVWVVPGVAPPRASYNVVRGQWRPSLIPTVPLPVPSPDSTLHSSRVPIHSPSTTFTYVVDVRTQAHQSNCTETIHIWWHFFTLLEVRWRSEAMENWSGYVDIQNYFKKINKITCSLIPKTHSPYWVRWCRSRRFLKVRCFDLIQVAIHFIPIIEDLVNRLCVLEVEHKFAKA